MAVQGPAGDGRHFGAVGRDAGEGDTDVEDVGGGAVAGALGDEHDRR